MFSEAAKTHFKNVSLYVHTQQEQINTQQKRTKLKESHTKLHSDMSIQLHSQLS